jgi:predicted nucleotidyltransferase
MRRDEVIQALQSHRTDLRDRGVKTLALFGSVVRGEARPESDVDLLVEFDRPVGLFEFLDLKEFLESVLNCNVDLGTPGGLRPRIRQRVLKEAVYVS